MDFNQFRLEQRATLVAQYDMKRTVYRNEIEDWIARYPQLEAALRQRYEEYSLSLDKEIAHFDSGQYQVDFDTSIETAKRKYWELLTLLNTADPALPIVEMHDEYCAAMDQAAMEARSQVRKLDELAEQTRVAMTDVVIDHHLARREAQGGQEGVKPE
ncbi:MAG TPA: hypothetical protein VFO38_02285 [Candidatus Saccharimonadales bacterium]|nr:hypothetical protein [Candidatus Saccharimonadales bacterium]